MPTWIRFRYDNGDTTLVNADETHILFKAEDQKIEVYPSHAGVNKDAPQTVCIFACEYPEQVTAAEELIFDGLSKGQPVTISLDLLDEHAEYLNHVHGIRMVLQLLHQGSLRIPVEDGYTDEELFDTDPEDNGQASEISQFENMLHTYLDVPKDTLRRAIKKEPADYPFNIVRDHEECEDHGFHEYWIVTTRPDCSYAFRDKFDDLAKTLIEKEGLGWQGSGN